MGDKGLPVLLDQLNEVSHVKNKTGIHGELQILNTLVDEWCELICYLFQLPLRLHPLGRGGRHKSTIGVNNPYRLLHPL